MAQIFDPLWIIYLPSLFIAIFIIISVIFALIKIKFEKTKISIFSTSITGLIFSVVNLCIACISTSLGFFSIFFNLPLILIGFLFGMSSISLSHLILEKTKRDFPFKEFIVTTSMITVSLSLMFLVYLIPNVIGEPRGTDEENIHIHADLKIFDNNKEIILYTPENMEKNRFYHFHDGKNQENVIHFEGKKGTIDNFLTTIGFQLYKLCTGYTRTYYTINGITYDIDEKHDYIINNLDKLLITCGEPTQEQINSIGNFACIQSKKC